jgi:hypothetical protein
LSECLRGWDSAVSEPPEVEADTILGQPALRDPTNQRITVVFSGDGVDVGGQCAIVASGALGLALRCERESRDLPPPS